MPLDRSSRLADQSVEMGHPEDIGRIFDALRRVPERGFFTRERAQRDVAEEVEYQLLVHPDWIRPHVADLVREGAAAAMTFDWQCLLLAAAPDELVHALINRVRAGQGSGGIEMLLATRNQAALEFVARAAATDEGVSRACRALGFDVNGGTLEPRFAVVRQALRIVLDAPALGAAHAVGLPLEAVVAPTEDRITFHYLSVSPSVVPALAAWHGQVHAVSIRSFAGWTMVGRADDQGRLSVLDIELENGDSLGDLTGKLDEDAAAPQISAAVEILPFDDRLLFVNQHPLGTPDVIGVIGGPPMGLAPAPGCPVCRRVMFHVGSTDTNTREYGAGFRSIFMCPDCRTSATVATTWN